MVGYILSKKYKKWQTLLIRILHVKLSMKAQLDFKTFL